MNNVTVVYVTGNYEEPEFEAKIQSKLLEVIGDKPLISVSQKPINFGQNVCIGDIGRSYASAYKQMLLGAETAQTEYVMVAEDDQLYPPGYFDFTPTADLHMYADLWVLRHWNKARFYKKEYGDWLCLVKKQFFIDRLKLKLQDEGKRPNNKLGSVFHKRRWETFDVGLPVITVKTRDNISENTGTMPLTSRTLPYWGKAEELSNYLGL